MPRGEPFWFGPRRDLFGVLHAPDPAESDVAVLLCAPFGSEMMATHRTYRHVAEHVAANGFFALRFDYDGTGDSAGHDRDGDRVAAWRASVDHACEELKRRSGATKIVVFGLRLGALLAVQAASDRDDVDAIVTYGASISGKRWLREVRAFQRLKVVESEPSSADGEEAVGFALTAETARALETLDVAKLAPKAKAALVLARDGRGDDAKLAETLAKAGVTVSTDVVPGFTELMQEDPYLAVVPRAAIAAIERWLVERYPTMTPPVAEPAPFPRLAEIGGIDERIVLFGNELSGIVSLPRTRSTGKVGAVFINVGANHRVGTNRMYVRFARAFAGRGVPSIRFDIAGVGESPALPGRQENRLYDDASIEDVREAIATLGAETGCTHFVLLGLCAGAYLAFQSALRVESVRAIFLINVVRFYWSEDDTVELVRTADWKRLKGGGSFEAVPLRARLAALRSRPLVESIPIVAHKVRNYARQRVRRELARRGLLRDTRLARDFADLRKRRVDVLCVFGEGEPALAELERDLVVVDDRRGFDIRLVPDTDHIFSPLRSQDHLERILLESVVAVPAGGSPRRAHPRADR